MSAELQREVITFLKDYGAKNVRIVPGGTHPRIYFNFKGEEKFTVVPGTSSDRRAVKNQIADLKRTLGTPVIAPVLRKRKLEEMMADATTLLSRSAGVVGRLGPTHHTPVINAPGIFEMIGIHDLKIDTRYQAPLKNNTVTRIAKKWSWPACGVLLVACRDNGDNYVFDGQHRLEAAKLSSGESWGTDITHLPCLVFKSLVFRDEAIGFLGANTERTFKSLTHQYNALVIAGDETAKKAEELMSVANRKVDSNAGPKTITCISGVMRAIRSDETALRRAWPAICAVLNGHKFHERILKGMHELERRMPNGRSLSDAKIMARLITVGPDEMLKSIRAMAAVEGNAGQRVAAIGIYRSYNKGNHSPLRIGFDR